MGKIKYNENPAAMTWEIENDSEDIGIWRLVYNDEVIKGKGFEEFLNAAKALSLNKNVVYVKRLRWFVHLARNFIGFKGRNFFANGSKEFYHIEIDDSVELRNWDCFWKKENDEKMFLYKLDICRTYYNHGESGKRNKNKLSLEKHFKFTLAKEMWTDMYNMYFFYQPWSKNFCEMLLPQDEDEWEYMCDFDKAGFYYRNEDFGMKIIPKLHCYDISSAFLSYLLRKPYPMESFKKTSDVKEIKKIIEGKYYCWYGYITFYKLEYKTNFHVDLQRFGQPNESEMCSWNLLLTDVDMEWFKLLFGWGAFGIDEIYYTRKKVLHNNYAQAFTSLYDIKAQQQKGTFGKEVSKFRAELPFGQPIKAVQYGEKTAYEEESNDFMIVPNEEKSFEQIKNELRKRGIPMYIGLWTAAYARQEFVKVLSKIGFENVVYGDTDSVKFIGDEGIKIIEEHNKEIEKEMKEITRRASVVPDKNMGKWICEGTYRNFKSIAIKTYYCEKYNEKEDRWDMEVKAAGCDSEVIEKYLKTKKNPAAAFSLYMDIPDLRYTIEYDKRTVRLTYLSKIDKNELFKAQRRETSLYYFNPWEEYDESNN